jgi:Putative bacterial sensory transduction regulator
MTSEPLCANLIEHYLCTRGSRYFRGAHDGEYFYVANTRPRRLHVHLEITPGHHDVLLVRVAPACFFPASDRPWLMHLADAWNRQDRGVTAIVHRSADPGRLGVVARRSQWIRGDVAFEDFATFVDRTVAAAIEFFGGLIPVLEQPATALVLDAG